jgi:hypothetical protein
VAIAGLTTILVPGIGIALAAGPLAAALGTAAATPSQDTEATNHLSRMLVHAGLLEDQAQTYAQYVLQGQSVVGVRAEDEQTDHIANIMHSHGGMNLDYRRE